VTVDSEEAKAVKQMIVSGKLIGGVIASLAALLAIALTIHASFVVPSIKTDVMKDCEAFVAKELKDHGEHPHDGAATKETVSLMATKESVKSVQMQLDIKLDAMAQQLDRIEDRLDSR